MKIIFAGTPEFAVPTLQALANSSHELIAVYTQPDRPSGRGRHLQPSPVKQCATTLGIPVFQPLTLKDPTTVAEFAALDADILIVVAYGLILPRAILNTPRYGCINVHASLLPRWRGAAPIQHAILAGDRETGVTIMQMEAGLDTGPMLQKVHTEIGPRDTSQDLHDRLAVLGAKALLDTLEQIEKQTLDPIVQDDSQATHAGKIQKSDAALDWSLSAITLERRVRGYYPWPIAYFSLAGATCRVIEATAHPEATHSALPGTVMSATPSAIRIATGEGCLDLLRLQLPGGKVLSVADILHARANLFTPGSPLV